MALDDCPVCGQPHPRCHSHKNTVIDWVPCMEWPRKHAHYCQHHRGNTPAHRAGEARRRRAAEVAADAHALVGFDLSGSVGDARVALDGLAAMQLAMVETMAKRVNSIVEMGHTNDRFDETLKVEYQFLERAIAQAHKILDTVAKHAPDSEASAAKNLLTSLAEKLDDMQEPPAP